MTALEFSRSRSSNNRSVRGRRRARLRFIRAGAVEARHGHPNEAEIHSELAAMVNQVIQNHATNAHAARQRENLLAARQERPLLLKVGVASRDERDTSLGDSLVERGQQLRAIFNLGRLVARPADGSVVQALGVHGHGQPLRYGANVSGKPAERSGFLVRLPVPFFVRDALQDFTRVFHFFIKFRQQGLADAHKSSHRTVETAGLAEGAEYRRIKSELSRGLSLFPGLRVQFPAGLTGVDYPHGSPAYRLLFTGFVSRFSLLQETCRERDGAMSGRRTLQGAGWRIEFHRDRRQAHGGQHAFALDGLSDQRWREAESQP